ncbi:MAG TPA: 50S ribosomal protein L25 [Gemmatimonadales bacterium]|jgi:large subunit ribosomal protein L25|nr:50S ribosomal protein L25 [Gemmatimonadales bacterium]
MARQATLEASPRERAGKGVARSLRRAGKVPAVIYGRGREPEALAVDTTALTRLLTEIAAATTLVDVTVEGRPPVKALIREIQRNPVRPADIIHLDLYEVHADEKISVEVPVHFVGVPEGVRNFGGVLDQTMHALAVKVLPTDIPEHLEVDVTALNIGQSIHVGELSFPKLEIMSDARATVCTVVAPRAEEVVAPTAEVEAVAEPELIRKPKEEGEEGEAEAEAAPKGKAKE